MMYGGSLSARGMRSRDDLAGFGDLDLDHRLPTSTRGSLSTALKDLTTLGIQPGHYSGSEQLFAAGGNFLAPAIEPAACEILGGGAPSRGRALRRAAPR